MTIVWAKPTSWLCHDVSRDAAQGVLEQLKIVLFAMSTQNTPFINFLFISVLTDVKRCRCWEEKE
jgi:hypothetical protein